MRTYYLPNLSIYNYTELYNNIMKTTLPKTINVLNRLIRPIKYKSTFRYIKTKYLIYVTTKVIC